MIASHEEYAKASDLDGVMSNVDPDVLVLTDGAPLVVGSASPDFPICGEASCTT